MLFRAGVPGHSLARIRITLTVTRVRLCTDAELISIGILLLDKGALGPKLLHVLHAEAYVN
jgi:hypothetical protein